MIQVGKTEIYFVEIAGERKELTPEQAEDLYQQLRIALGKNESPFIYPTMPSQPWILPTPNDFPFDREWTTLPTVTD